MKLGYAHLFSHPFKVIMCYHSDVHCGLGKVTLLTSMDKVPIRCKFLVFSGDFIGKYKYKEMVEMPATTLKLDIGHSLFLMLELFLIFVVPSIMLYSSEISPTRCNNCIFFLRNGFALHVSGNNLTHHQEYICCIWPQVSRLT